MNKIEISKLKNSLKKISELAENYEENHLNYYKTLENLKPYWISKKGDIFFEKTYQEQKNQKNIIKNLEEIKKIYDYIENKYKKIGDKVYFSFKNIDKLSNIIEVCINRLTKIINLYNNLNFENFTNEQINILIEEQKIITKNLESIQQIKEELINKLELLEEIENKIELKISNIIINVNIHQDNSINIEKNTNEIIVEIEELEKAIKLINMYKNEESILIEEIKKYYKDINYFYKTSNTTTLDKIKGYIIKEMNNIVEIHNNNKTDLELEQAATKELEIKVSKILSEE